MCWDNSVATHIDALLRKAKQEAIVRKTGVLRYEIFSHPQEGLGRVNERKFTSAEAGFADPLSRISIDVEYRQDGEDMYHATGFLMVESHLPKDVENSRGEVTEYPYAHIDCFVLGDISGQEKDVLRHYILEAKKVLTNNYIQQNRAA
jgi:hypothetical protein